MKQGIAMTSGEVVDRVFDMFKSDLNKIDWTAVRESPNYNGILADYTLVNPTTLNLSEETIQIIEQFRGFFRSELQMKRTVYRSYIIRIVLKAHKLNQEKHDIFK